MDDFEKQHLLGLVELERERGDQLSLELAKLRAACSDLFISAAKTARDTYVVNGPEFRQLASLIPDR